MGKFSLKDFFGSAIDSVVSSVGDALDKNITSKEEKMAAEKAVTEVLLNYQTEVDKGVTERLKIDMQSDNKLAKLIRPASLIYTTVIVSALAITDGNFGEFKVEESYILLFKTLMGLQYMFYFGSRGAEKIIEKIYNKNK